MSNLLRPGYLRLQSPVINKTPVTARCTTWLKIFQSKSWKYFVSSARHNVHLVSLLIERRHLWYFSRLLSFIMSVMTDQLLNKFSPWLVSIVCNFSLIITAAFYCFCLISIQRIGHGRTLSGEPVVWLIIINIIRSRYLWQNYFRVIRCSTLFFYSKTLCFLTC